MFSFMFSVMFSASLIPYNFFIEEAKKVFAVELIVKVQKLWSISNVRFYCCLKPKHKMRSNIMMSMVK